MSDNDNDLDRYESRQSRHSRRSPSRSASPSPSRSWSGSQSGSRSSQSSPYESDRADENLSPANDTVDPPAAVSFCLKHKRNEAIDTCPTCRACQASVAAAPSPSEIVPPANARFSRSDEKAPTVVFRDTTLDLMCNVFSAGRFKVANHFEELTKEHFYTSGSVNEILTANLTMEPMLRKLERSGKEKAVFIYKNQQFRNIRESRVAEVQNCLTFNCV